MFQVLAGVRVVEVAGWVFVPTAGTVLSDWGAEVIKIEDPVEGDPFRALYNSLTLAGGPNPMYEVSNRGKRSVGVDLTHTEGREVLYGLIRSADVLLTSLRRPAREKLGITVEEVRSHNPDIVYAVGTGYGSRGPEADRPGFDSAASWARAGIAYQMRRVADGEPPLVPGSIGDLVGGLTLAGGVATALAHRAATGEATEVEVSLLAIGMWLMAQNITAAPIGGAGLPRERRDARNPLTVPYRARDGRWIQLAMFQSQRAWPDLCRRLDREDLITDPRFASFEAREQHARECIAVLDEVFAARPVAEWMRRLDGIDGVWDLVASPREVAEDAQAIAEGYLPMVRSLDGATSYRGVASPIRFGGDEIGQLDASPEHGQHTEEVLLELGLSWDRLAELKEVGAIL